MAKIARLPNHSAPGACLVFRAVSLPLRGSLSRHR